MKFKNTLEIVTKDIQDIEKLVSNFKNYSGIPNIELDLALSKLRNVYDVLLMFRETADSSVSEPETTGSVPETEPGELTASFMEKEKVHHIADNEGSEEIPGSQSPVKDEKSMDDIMDTAEIPVYEKKISQIQKSGLEAKKTIGDRFVTDQAKINEKLGEKLHKSDITSAFQSSPIKTISGGVGINDKFFFIRELFNGDNELFNQTLHELDNSVNFNSACSFLMNKFSWDMESDPVQKLLNLIRRKFISPGNE